MPTPASATEKLLHWTVAGSVLVMLATGALMYVPALSVGVGERFWIRSLHLGGAVALVAVLIAVPLLRWRELRGLERELAEWSAEDWAWFRRPWDVFAGEAPVAVAVEGRFNAGQKLFAAIVAMLLVVLLATGVPMFWWGRFSAELVARARDLHLLAAFAATALIAGHVYLGLLSPYGLLAAPRKETR